MSSSWSMTERNCILKKNHLHHPWVFPWYLPLPGSSTSSSILRLQEYSTAFLYSTSTLSCSTPFYAFAVSTSSIFYHRLVVHCTSLYLREFFDINLSNRLDGLLIVTARAYHNKEYEIIDDKFLYHSLNFIKTNI